MTRVLPSTELRDTLFSYVEWGWPVLPIWGIASDGNGARNCQCPAGGACKQSPGKHPVGELVPHGVKDAAADKSVIQAWMAEAPEANWAIATGHRLALGGFLVVLDVDPRNRGDESLADLETIHGKLPATVRQISGGNGAHYFFKTDEPLRCAILGEGIEIKGEGGYLLVEPSKHMSGGTYRFDAGAHPDETAIAPLPEWVHKRIGNGRKFPKLESTGRDARDSMLGAAFEELGWLGEPLTEGKRAVKCPWSDLHTDNRGTGEDSSTALMPPSAEYNQGGFKCHHSHCVGKTWQDVRDALPPDVVARARDKFKPRGLPSKKPPPSQRTPGPPPSVRGLPAVAAKTPRLAAAAQSVPLPVGDVETLKRCLIYKMLAGGDSVLERCAANVVAILLHDPRWHADDKRPRVRYNQWTQRIECIAPPWLDDELPPTPHAAWEDTDTTRLINWIQRTYHVEMRVEHIERGVAVAAEQTPVHPLRDWLDSLKWDQEFRLRSWPKRYLGADETPYTLHVGRWWMISGVARIYNPGCKVDHVLVLESDQGKGKSTAFRDLAGEGNFLDSALDLNSHIKDAYITIRGKWIVELAELADLHRAEVSRAKAFFTSTEDTYRPPHGRASDTRSFPRQCIFGGTVNQQQYLRDETGNRRYWPIKCGEIDSVALRRDRELLWAEAVWAFKEGAKWYPETDEERAACELEQDQRYQGDEWEALIGAYLEPKKLDADYSVTVGDLLETVIHLERGKWGKSEQTRIGVCLQRLGWANARRTVGGKQQRVWYWIRPRGG